MKPLSHALVAACLLALIPAAAQAQSAEPGIEGRVVGNAIFDTMDLAGRGAVHMGEIEDFRATVFLGMDSNEDFRVTYEEFSMWDPGFSQVAAELGRSEAYATASKIIFAFWDRDADGELDNAEMRLAMTSDFRRADLDDDGLLSREEFIQGFPIMVAMRAAIRPDL
ncbi:MAG: hypothetical protein Rhims3KO_04680 [Hyphomicrobiales bacterium]